MSERGSLSIVMLAGTFVLCLFAVCAADLGSLLVARARAHAASESAALAAAVALTPVLAQGSDPAGRARDAAERNGARLERCWCEAGSSFAEVEVSIAAPVAVMLRWGGARVRATARAALDEDVLSYRAAG